MATLKPVIHTVKSNGEGRIKIILIHNSKSAYITTPYYIPKSFMLDSGKVSSKYSNADTLNEKLKELLNKYEAKLIKIPNPDTLSVIEIRNLLATDAKSNTQKTEYYFFPLAYSKILELKNSGKKTWEVYSNSIKQLEHFKPIIQVKDITTKFLEDFEHYCLTKEKPIKFNSISVYLRSLHTVLKLILRDYPELGSLLDPFKEFKIKGNKTKKRNLSLEQIRLIRDYQTDNSFQIIARDMCMLTFYLIGINPIDLYWAVKPVNGRLEYLRAKTMTKNGREYSIKIEHEAQRLIEAYSGENYLLHFADHNYSIRSPRAKYTRFYHQFMDHRKFGDSVNTYIKQICKELKFYNWKEITIYWFRHSWATIAYNDCDISEEKIAFCLGHDKLDDSIYDSTTTQLYIEKKKKIVDTCNRMVIDKLNEIHSPLST